MFENRRIGIVGLSPLLLLSLLPGCQEKSAAIPNGCYRFPSGDPFLIARGDELLLLVKGEVQSSTVGPWVDMAGGRFRVSPGFYLHDGTVSPPNGPAVMSQKVKTRRSGSLTYRRVGNQDLLLIPVEAYGYKRVVRGAPCKEVP
jgi:hypothetical protein